MNRETGMPPGMLPGVPAGLVLERLIAEPGGEPMALTIEAGMCVALLTGQHSSASALIDHLAGHASTVSGRVTLNGLDITGLPPVLRRIGVLSARDPLFGHMSVLQNVAFPLAVRRVREPERGHRVRQILALLGIEALADRRPASLGSSDYMRATLARVLVCDPAVVLLDDPLGSLDPASRREMHHLLRRLARARGLAFLLVTRDREEALMMGERIGILDGSVLRQIGTAGELLDRPADEHVATGFGEANAMTGQVEWVEDDVARIRLAAGASMEAMASGSLSEGALCVVCVRPERVAVAFVSGTDSAFDSDSLVGTLSDLIHLGDHVRLRFRLAGGGEMLVRRPASQPTAGLRADKRALLAWQAAHAVAFPLSG